MNEPNFLRSIENREEFINRVRMANKDTLPYLQEMGRQRLSALKNLIAVYAPTDNDRNNDDKFFTLLNLLVFDLSLQNDSVQTVRYAVNELLRRMVNNQEKFETNVSKTLKDIERDNEDLARYKTNKNIANLTAKKEKLQKEVDALYKQETDLKGKFNKEEYTNSLLVNTTNKTVNRNEEIIKRQNKTIQDNEDKISEQQKELDRLQREKGYLTTEDVDQLRLGYDAALQEKDVAIENLQKTVRGYKEMETEFVPLLRNIAYKRENAGKTINLSPNRIESVFRLYLNNLEDGTDPNDFPNYSCKLRPYHMERELNISHSTINKLIRCNEGNCYKTEESLVKIINGLELLSKGNWSESKKTVIQRYKDFYSRQKTMLDERTKGIITTYETEIDSFEAVHNKMDEIKKKSEKKSRKSRASKFKRDSLKAFGDAEV